MIDGPSAYGIRRLGDGPTAELEILRGEQSRILVEHTAEKTEYRFDTQLADVADHGDHVSAVTGVAGIGGDELSLP